MVGNELNENDGNDYGRNDLLIVIQFLLCNHLIQCAREKKKTKEKIISLL